jgi:hypothetical protein
MMRSIQLLLLTVAISCLASSAQSQMLYNGMTSAEVDSVLKAHPHIKVEAIGVLSLSPVDSPGELRDYDKGTFKWHGVEFLTMEGTLEFTVKLEDTIRVNGWRSIIREFENSNDGLRESHRLFSLLSKITGPADYFQDPETLIDRYSWKLHDSELRLIYDSRFLHLYAVWIPNY